MAIIGVPVGTYLILTGGYLRQAGGMMGFAIHALKDSFRYFGKIIWIFW